jgi:hypothetical protein
MIIVIAALITAFFWHLLATRVWVAHVGTVVTTPILVFAVASSHFGWLDKTFFMNLAITIGITVVVSVVVGFVFQGVRRKRVKV